MARISSRRGDVLALAALATAVLAGSILAFAPLSSSVHQRAEVSSGGGEAEVHPPVLSSSSLFEEEGPRALSLVAVPAAIGGLGLIRRRSARVASASLLWVFVMLGAVSFGLYFVVPAGLMTASAVATPRLESAR